jgi:F-type H+-transporting ATPase subunit a
MNEGLHIELAAERVGTFLGLPITNAMLTAWGVSLLLIVTAYFIGRRPKLIPGKFQLAIEWMFEFVIDYMEKMLGSRKLALRYFPLVMSIFLFVFTANELEFLPIIGSIGLREGGAFIPLFRGATADLNLTLALAIIAFLTIEISGIAMLGFLKYGSKFINIKGGAMGIVVGVLELIGNIARLISFSFRLFGNIFAGEVLVAVAAAFLPLLLPVPIILFESFVGLLQAAIFALLTLAFIQLAIAEPHGDEHGASKHSDQIPNRKHA